MIDAHCHLEYMENPDKIIDEAMKKMTAIVTSCAEPEYKDKTLSLSKKYDGFVFSCLGLHPEPAEKMSQKEINDYINFIHKHKNDIVAIGEVGLDYKIIKDKFSRKESQMIFRMFVDLANELDLPLVIHCRDAYKDCFKVLENAKVDVVLHCFSGTDDDLKEALSRGYYISLSTLTVKSLRRQAQAKNVPLDKMLLETDSPWLDPFSNELKNRPWNISFTADVVAKEKGILTAELLNATTKNAIKVFRLKNLKKAGVDWIVP